MPSDSPGSLLQSSAASPGMPVLAVGAWPSAWRRGLHDSSSRSDSSGGGPRPLREVSITNSRRPRRSESSRPIGRRAEDGPCAPQGRTRVKVDVLAGVGEPPDAVLEQDRAPGVEAVGGDGVGFDHDGGACRAQVADEPVDPPAIVPVRGGALVGGGAAAAVGNVVGDQHQQGPEPIGARRIPADNVALVAPFPTAQASRQRSRRSGPRVLRRSGRRGYCRARVSRRFVECAAADADGQQVDDDPELAHGRGVREGVSDDLCVGSEVPDERAE